MSAYSLRCCVRGKVCENRMGGRRASPSKRRALWGTQDCHSFNKHLLGRYGWVSTHLSTVSPCVWVVFSVQTITDWDAVRVVVRIWSFGPLSVVINFKWPSRMARKSLVCRNLSCTCLHRLFLGRPRPGKSSSSATVSAQMCHSLPTLRKNFQGSSVMVVQHISYLRSCFFSWLDLAHLCAPSYQFFPFRIRMSKHSFES